MAKNSKPENLLAAALRENDAARGKKAKGYFIKNLDIIFMLGLIILF